MDETQVAGLESNSLIRMMLREAMDDFSAIPVPALTDINPLIDIQRQPEELQETTASSNSTGKVIMAAGIIALGLGLFSPDLLRRSIGASSLSLANTAIIVCLRACWI
jgi:hypothetical protein